MNIRVRKYFAYLERKKQTDAAKRLTQFKEIRRAIQKRRWKKILRTETAGEQEIRRAAQRERKRKSRLKKSNT